MLDEARRTANKRRSEAAEQVDTAHHGDGRRGRQAAHGGAAEALKTTARPRSRPTRWSARPASEAERLVVRGDRRGQLPGGAGPYGRRRAAGRRPPGRDRHTGAGRGAARPHRGRDRGAARAGPPGVRRDDEVGRRAGRQADQGRRRSSCAEAEAKAKELVVGGQLRGEQGAYRRGEEGRGAAQGGRAEEGRR